MLSRMASRKSATQTDIAGPKSTIKSIKNRIAAKVPEDGAAGRHVALAKPAIAWCRAMIRRAAWAAREFDAGLLDSQDRWHRYGLQL